MVDEPQLETLIRPQPGRTAEESEIVSAGGTYRLETVVIPRKPRHLEFIQQAVDRIEANSILLKGWTIILTATLLGLFADDASTDHIFTLSLPVIGFWTLDGLFQSQQRLLRALYDRVRDKPESEIDFSMDTSMERQDPRNGLLPSMIFSNLFLFYGPVIVIVLVTAGLLSF